MERYNALITNASPSAMLYLLDMSGSMSENIVFNGEMMPKNEALCRIVNSAIYEIVCRCRQFQIYNDYFDIAVLGYGGDGIVDLLEQYVGKGGFCSIQDLVSVDIGMVSYSSFKTKSDGTKFISRRVVPRYVDYTPGGVTPMYAGLEKAYQFVQAWIRDKKGRKCFPPIIINVSDGEVTDAIPREMIMISRKIKRLATEDGNVLLFNIHLGNTENDIPIIFPNEEEELPEIRNIKMLYEMSSELPPLFYDEIKSIKNCPDVSHARAMTYNANVSTLIKALEIGSISKSLIE